jgi:transcriptional regulator with XRE-family HTH domain
MARKERKNDNLLRRTRGSHKMTIKEMAEHTGFDPSYLSAIETGRRPASQQVIEQYEKVLKLRPGELSAARDAAGDLVKKAIDGIGTPPEAGETGTRHMLVALRERTIFGEAEVLRSRIRLIQAAVEQAMPAGSELLITSMSEQYGADPALSLQCLQDQWKASLIQALQQGINITHIWRVSASSPTTTLLVTEMLDYLGYSGVYKPYVIHSQDVHQPAGHDLLLVPGQGALFCFGTLQPGALDAAFFYHWPEYVHEYSALERHFQLLFAQATEVFSVYQGSAEFADAYVRAHTVPGDLLIEMDRLSLIGMTLAIYNTYLERQSQRGAPHSMPVEQMYRFRDRFRTFVNSFGKRLEEHTVLQFATKSTIMQMIRDCKIGYSPLLSNSIDEGVMEPAEITMLINNIIYLLRKHPNYQLCLLDKEPMENPGSKLLTVVDNAVVLRAWSLYRHEPIDITIQEPSVVQSLREYFMKKWNAARPESKNKQQIITWLHDQLEQVGAI